MSDGNDSCHKGEADRIFVNNDILGISLASLHMLSLLQSFCNMASSGSVLFPFTFVSGDGQGSLAGSSPWGHKESDTTE